MKEEISNIKQGIKNSEVKIHGNDTKKRDTRLKVSFDEACVDFAFDKKVMCSEISLANL